jgi:DNA-binding CsgD family transcriptional regulator
MFPKLKNIFFFILDRIKFRYGSPSLYLRLIAFFTLFVIVISLALSSILFACGVFSSGFSESRLFFQSEFEHLSTQIENDYGTLTAEGLILSSRISQQISSYLEDKRIPASRLKEHPEILEDILRLLIDPSLAMLEKNTTSGVFVILDATVNPMASHGENSRSGLFIRNMEPNAASHSNPSIYYMRGPASLARERHMYMLPQWQMEFSVAKEDFFHKTMEDAQNGTSANHTYYWNPAQSLTQDYEDAMLLCIPIFSSDGFVLGICGFEINSMLFKIQYLPGGSRFDGSSVIFAPVMEDGSLDASKSLFSGRHPFRQTGQITVSEWKNSLSAFEADGETYIGLHRPIRLYPKNTIYGNERWELALWVPESEVTAYSAQKNFNITILLAVLFVFAIGSAIALSYRYLVPVLAGIDQIMKGEAENCSKIRIREIDDLFAFLAAQDNPSIPDSSDQSESPVEAPPSYNSSFQEFFQNLQTLSKAERAVFNLYVKGYDAKEVAEILFISYNTVKSHNRKIYYKLGVGSLKELKAHLRTMKESGCMIDTEKEESR